MRITSAALLLLAASAQAQLWVVENFDSGINAAGWTFGAPNEVLQPTGGFWGGPYLAASGLQTAVPMVRTGQAGTSFTGNYRSAGVTTVAAALLVQQSAAPVTSMHPAVLLVSFNGTPGDPLDDWGAYFVSTETLAAIGSWRFFNFTVPSTLTSLPTGWSYLQLGPNAPGPDWNTLCQAVDRLAFTFDRPTAAPAPQAWEVGADYLNISGFRACYPNCDNSTSSPCLNIQDYICFINQFYSGDARANCDGSTVVPWLNVQDFACFLMRYAAGCSDC
jgi:hypothetical protein